MLTSNRESSQVSKSLPQGTRKEEQNKPKASGRKEKVNTRVEINDTENMKTTGNIQQKSGSLGSKSIK